MADYRKFMLINSPITQQSSFETNDFWLPDIPYENVSQPNKQDDYETKYKELFDKYNRLNDEHNQLMKEHLKVLNKYRSLTDKYTELLEENNKQDIARTLDNENKITIK